MDTKNLPWQLLREKVFHKSLARDEKRNFQIDLIRLEPNTTLRKHSHKDVEWVYVLKGEMRDERGVYKAHDFIINKKDSEHTVSTEKEGVELLVCWCGEIIPV